MNGGRNPKRSLRITAAVHIYEHQFCAKRFFNLLQAIFRSPENDFPFCGKRFSR